MIAADRAHDLAGLQQRPDLCMQRIVQSRALDVDKRLRFIERALQSAQIPLLAKTPRRGDTGVVPIMDRRQFRQHGDARFVRVTGFVIE